MDPITILSAASAALNLIQELAPLIQAAVQKGEITVAQQEELDAKIAALKPGGTAFAGPEWKPSNG